MATFSVTSKTSNSMSTKITGMDGTFAEWRYFYWYRNGTYVDLTAELPYATSASYEYIGLSPSTYYTLTVEVKNSLGGLLTSFSTSGTTNSAPTPTKPTKWAWTTAESNAFNGNGAFSTLTASRWNAFIDKINEVCIYASSSWTSTHTTLAGAKASAGGALTALKFNSVKLNIGSRIPTGISDVATGSSVLGSYFITLCNKLNDWIDTL